MYVDYFLCISINILINWLITGILLYGYIWIDKGVGKKVHYRLSNEEFHIKIAKG